MSLYNYDKEPNCEWCEFGTEDGQDIKCSVNDTLNKCQHFKYDVFKRKPTPSPKLQDFDYDDFNF
jgi:hypothetical protein